MRTSLALLAPMLLVSSILSAQGTITTFSATSGSGLAIDAQGTVYATDSSTARVRKISSSAVSIIAGTGNFGYAGDGGPALSATLFMGSGVSGVAVDGAGNIYFSDGYNNVVRKINTQGIISTYAGNGTGAGTGFGGFTGDNGLATSAQLDGPTDIAIDSNGNLYICDTGNSRVRKVTPGGIITTFAGNGNVAFSGDNGQATAAAVPSPGGITVDAQGNVYISSARRVRKVAPNGMITTIAGTGTAGFSGDGGPGTSATLRGPVGLGVDQFGNVYVADNSNGRVRKIDAAGIITTYAGIDGNASTPLGDGGPATNAYLGNVGDLMVDSSGNVYVEARGGIRKISPAGAGFIATPSSLSFSATTGGAAPASQSVNITSSGAALSFTASASSTGNWLSVTPTSGTTPATLSASANTSGLGAGTYTGTITLTPSGAGNSPLAISVTLTISGANSPVINTGQIYNATGYQAKLAPDTVFVIFGSNMGPSAIQIATAPNYQTLFGGTSITFTPTAGGNAVDAKIVYTLAGQVAGLLPSAITPGTYAVRVTYNGLTSAPQNVTVVARSFGIAAANSGGSGMAQATIGNVNNGISLTRFTAGSVSFNGLNWTLTPAHPGDTIVLWGTGGGADAANDTGGTSGDQTAAGNFRVTAGSRTITPLYAGASSGYPGLWQINFTLPTDMTSDCFMTVSVSAGGEVGNSVIIPVAATGQANCVDPTMPAPIFSKLDSGATINMGAFALARVTSSGVTQETASGSILSFTPTEWTILSSGPVFGACRVYDRTYPQNGKDPGAADSFLNTGTRLALSGPNLAAGSGLGVTATPSGPFYLASLAQGTFTSGSYTITSTGGADVGPFSSTTVFPATFNATNFASIATINRSQPLTFTWTGTGFDQVGIIVATSLTTGGLQHLTTLQCTVPAGPGTYTVPAAALAVLLPATLSGTSFGNVTLTGINTQGTFTANLTRGGQLDIGTFWAEIGVGKNIAVQ